MRRTSFRLCVAVSLAAGVAVTASATPAGIAGQAPPGQSAVTAGRTAAHRPRPVHATRPGQTRRELAPAPRLHPQRDRGVLHRGAREAPAQRLSSRVPVVRPGRLSDSQPCPIRRRRDFREGPAELRGGVVQARAGAREAREGASRGQLEGERRASPGGQHRRSVPGGAGEPAERAAVRVGGVLPPVPVRARQLLSGRTRAIRRTRRPSHRVLPDGPLRRPDAPSPPHEARAGEAGRAADRRHRRAGDRAEAEQGRAHHAVGRPVRVPRSSSTRSTTPSSTSSRGAGWSAWATSPRR